MKAIVIICFFWIFCQGWSQQAGQKAPVDSGFENYRIMTDRSIYMVGEDINFRVFNLHREALNEINWSKVFYVELISPQGFAHRQVKVAVDSCGAGGSMELPGDLPTGTYYLKGYTKWMRNYGPSTYSYLSVEIVNPNIRAVLPVDTSSNFSVSLRKCNNERISDGFVTLNNTDQCERRSQVQFDLRSDQNEFAVDCCIAVIRKGVRKTQWESAPVSDRVHWNWDGQLPETRGISLAGKVVYSGSDIPAPYPVIYISLIGEEREFFCNYADSAGRFHFAFPDKYGETDLFISAGHPDSTGLELFIDQDFCTESISLPSFSTEINQVSKGLIQEMWENAQIMEQYFPGHIEMDQPVFSQRDFFYGTPSAVIRFDDFIRLPTIEEYFSEVTPLVSLRKSNRKHTFRVLGDHPDLEIYAPLLMIDGIAIYNVESVLAVSPGYVDRIEIIDAPYVRGNVTFGGIINLISRNDDMASVDLPDSGLLVNYKMYNQSLLNDQILQPSDPRLPGLDNTVYWDPHVVVTPGESTTIRFQTSDISGVFQVLIRGYDTQGKFVEEVFSYITN